MLFLPRTKRSRKKMLRKTPMKRSSRKKRLRKKRSSWYVRRRDVITVSAIKPKWWHT